METNVKQNLLKFLLTFLLAAAAVPALAQAKHALTFDDLMKVQRISDPQVSPDGKWVAYVVSKPDLDANKMVSNIWRVPLAGGEPQQLTRGDASDSRPRWSPDSKSIAFISSRNGTSQVWILPAGGEARQLTHIATEADGVTWASKANTLLFTSEVYPACHDQACNQEQLDEAKSSKVKARVINRLFFRHWDRWLDGKLTHLFAVPAEGGEPRDLTPGPYTSPTFFLGAPDGYAISPDGKEVCYTSNHSQPLSSVAWTTNNDLFLVSASGGEARDITAANPGSDASPQFSPNGRYIAYTSQATNGYESSLFRLRVYDHETGQIKDLTPGFEQWVLSFAWAPDSDTIYFIAPEGIEQPIFRTSVSHPHVVKVLGGYNDELSVAPGGGSLVFTHQSLTKPPEIYTASASGGDMTPLTHMNDAVMAGIEMNPGETVKTPGALGAQIESILVKPPAFDPSRKYPGLMLIHGGPQESWTDSWFYRWNAELFASFGYVVMMTNFHGSLGYGQPFTAEISGDWGGAPYEDLMKATDNLASLPYVDKNRIGAAGASFGGYMIDWIEGHTDRFKVLVSHDGVYDLRSMYGETEELWFPEWELKGVPWKNPALYEKWSPSYYIQNAKTPMLIFEGNRDFRVPEGQAIQLFTSLQRQGVPSKFVYFEQEGHLVMKPLDSRFWYQTVQDWLAKYLK